MMDTEARAPARAQTLWSAFVEALRGSEQDFTEGSIGRAVFLLAVPMVAEMIMESVFALVDIFFVSKLGADAVAVVGITESILILFYAVALGLAMASAATVARRVGEKDPDGAAVAAVQSIALGLAVAAVLGVGGAVLAPELLGLLGASGAVVRAGSAYASIMLGGNVTILLLYLINAIFRGVGDAAVAMRVLWLANLANIVLCPCFIFGWGPFPELGVNGAAIATNIGRGSGILLQFILLARGSERIRIRRAHVRVHPRAMSNLLRLGASGALQVGISTASWIGLVRIITTFGSAAVAGYTIGIRLIVFALFPSVGLGNAAATLVGQNLGARKPERAERSVWVTSFFNMLLLGTVGVVFLTFTDPIIRLFTSELDVIGYGTDCLRIGTYGLLFYAFGIILEQAFNGAGDIWTPTCINLGCFWLFEIPTAYVLTHHLGMGPKGVFVSIAAAFSLFSVVAAVLFRGGRWKAQRV
ncbi:MATE family efflux transporter [Pendulispora albinea]|uniref:Multidrug-efflux transporter n=1 Tax=Pendulispora albinea TaxID=2741071 RepID=A0ABZ2M4X5_9BACT